jgi:hypothetical protein
MLVLKQHFFIMIYCLTLSYAFVLIYPKPRIYRLFSHYRLFQGSYNKICSNLIQIINTAKQIFFTSLIFIQDVKYLVFMQLNLHLNLTLNW